jgi:hypothetical protein
MICGGHVKYYDPEKLKTDEEIQEVLGIRKIKVNFEGRQKEGFVCYACLGKIFADEVLKGASPRVTIRLASKQFSQQLGSKRG